MCVSLWVCEVGKRPQSQRHGHVNVSVPLGCGNMWRWGEDALGHAGGLQQRPQLLPSCYYGNEVVFIGAPGDWTASGDCSQLGEEQRHPEMDRNTQLHHTREKKKKKDDLKNCTAVSHLGMRSCDRDASLARALIRVVMTLGAAQTAPGAGADEVISNSTASSASKQEVMRLTEQRESHDTDRYSPSTHTWKGNKLDVILCQASARFTAECDISQYFNAWEKMLRLEKMRRCEFCTGSKMHRK